MVPMFFVSGTTLVAGWLNITDNFWPLTANPGTAMQGYVNSILTLIMMVCAIIILIESAKRWYKVLVKKEFVIGGELVTAADKSFNPPDFGCC